MVPSSERESRRGRTMMGRRNQGQAQLFCEFRLDDAVPDDHLVRKIGAVLDLSWVYTALARPITPRSVALDRPRADDPHVDHWLCVRHPAERQICREVRVNLAYRWFCELGLEDPIPDDSAFSRARNDAYSSGS